jgi:hypothetical protein
MSTLIGLAPLLARLQRARLLPVVACIMTSLLSGALSTRAEGAGPASVPGRPAPRVVHHALLHGGPAGHPVKASFSCGKKGHWDCTRYWTAGTTFRSMSGTKIECGGDIFWLGVPGYCGDLSHSQPTSWIDIAGGLSQTCDDHSTSFYGPLSGEWDGCTAAYQQSTGYQPIASLEQQASFWPFVGGVHDVWDDDYCYTSSDPHGPPPYVWYYGPATFTVNGVFATVYDLDTCIVKQLMGTIYWPSFTVTSQINTDETDYKLVYISGSVGTACATPQSSCENDSLCADLSVQAVQECTWTWNDPRTRCDTECP